MIASRLSSSIVGTSAVVAVLALAPTNAFPQVNVVTHHNDNARTGANLAEVQLNTSNVNASQFGKLFAVLGGRGRIRAAVGDPQPQHPRQGGAQRRVRGDDEQQRLRIRRRRSDNRLVSAHLAGQFQQSRGGDNSCAERRHQWTTSNYAVRTASWARRSSIRRAGTIYLVARTKENGSYFQRLHALDITTGKRDPGARLPSMQSFGSTRPSAQPEQNQRPALTLANGRVYIVLGLARGHQPYQGWVIAYDATTLQQQACSTPPPRVAWRASGCRAKARRWMRAATCM